MSSRYQQQFSIPDGFPALLKDFTREILRNQPSNLFAFGAQYFAEKRSQSTIETKDEPQNQVAAATEEPRNAFDRAVVAENYQDLSEAVYGLFQEADDNANGTLDRQEFAAVLQNGRLGLSSQIVDRVLAEADDNEDGVIEYTEFVPILMDIIAVDNSARAAAKEAQELVDGMRDNMHEFLLYGVPRKELEKVLNRVFEEADPENLGQLNRNDFKQCLQTSELSLTRKDVNLLMSKVELDSEGRVDYRVFIPMCFSILVERFADQVITSTVLDSEDGMRAAIMQCFTEFDVEGKGELTVRNVKHALQRFSDDVVPLTVYQIHTLVSVAPVNDNGIVKYTLMVPIVERTVRAIIDLQHMKTRFYVIEQLAQSDLLTDLSQAEPEKFRELLKEAFQRADSNNSGTLTGGCGGVSNKHDTSEEQGLNGNTGRQVTNVLRDLADSTGHSLRLDPAVWQSLLAVVDADDNGNVDWSELVQFMGDVFMHIERERKLQGALKQHSENKVIQDTAAAPSTVDVEPAVVEPAVTEPAVTEPTAAEAEPAVAEADPAVAEAEPAVALKTRQSKDEVREQLDTDSQ